MSQHRYLDPTNDVAFKKVFGHKERLKDFLNAILRRPDGFKIIELNFIPQEEIPDLGQGKRSIFDLKCKDESGKVYVIEMQNRREPHFLKRVQCYASHTYVSQLSVGDWHADLMPVIVVAISKSNLFPKDVKCISYHRTREDETNQQHLFELTYVFIELGKFTKQAEEVNSIEDSWLYFLAKSQIAKEPPRTITDEMVLQAYKAIEQFNWSESEYDAYLRARLLAEAEELTLEKSYDDGKQDGIELGKQEGIELGKQEGIQLGKQEIKKIILNMLAKGQSISFVTEMTGLTEDDILKLKDGK